MKGSSLSRRAFLKSAGIAGAGLALAACAPPAAAPAPAAPQEEAAPKAEAPAAAAATLRYQSFQSGDVVKKWEEQFVEFEKETGIKVTHEHVPWGDTITKDLTLAAGDQLPDIAMVSGNWHRSLAIRDLFLDMTDTAFGKLKVDDFWPKLLGGYKYQDKIYGFPTDCDLQVLYFNKELFDNAKVGYPTADWTWADYRTAAKQLTQGEGAGKTYGASTPDKQTALMHAWSYGGDLVDPEKLVAVLDVPPGKDAMYFLNDLLVTDKSAPLPGTEGAGMDTGRVAMGMMGPWAAWYVFREAKFPWDVVPIPKGNERVTLAWGSVMGIFAPSKNKEAAAKFVDFFLAPEMQYQRAADWAWFPPGKAATEQQGFMDKSVMNMEPGQKQFVIDSVASGRVPLVVKEQAKIDNIFSEELGLVASGGKSIDQAIADIKKSWDPLLQEK